METFLGAEREPIDFDALFQEQDPAGTGDDMDKYLLYVSTKITL